MSISSDAPQGDNLEKNKTKRVRDLALSLQAQIEDSDTKTTTTNSTKKVSNRVRDLTAGFNDSTAFKEPPKVPSPSERKLSPSRSVQDLASKFSNTSDDSFSKSPSYNRKKSVSSVTNKSMVSPPSEKRSKYRTKTNGSTSSIPSATSPLDNQHKQSTSNTSSLKTVSSKAERNPSSLDRKKSARRNVALELDAQMKELENLALTSPSKDIISTFESSTPIKPILPKIQRKRAPSTRKPTSVAKPRNQFSNLQEPYVFGLGIVNFNHTRGPELEYWVDDTVLHSQNPEVESESRLKQINKIWPHLPFQALPDGAHLFDEVFTNFTLIYDELKDACPELPFNTLEEVEKDQDGDADLSKGSIVSENPIDKFNSDDVITLFGCACLRQVESSQLHNETDLQEVKRSVIQKSIVLITRYPLTIQLKEKLSIITTSYFEQFNFEDKSIIMALYENLSLVYNKYGFKVEDDDLYESLAIPKTPDLEHSNLKTIKESDFNASLNLKSIVLKLKRNLLVIYKALLLEKRILVFSKDLNRLSNFQYGLLSLNPNLLLKLSDSGYPLSHNITKNFKGKPTSLKSSDRASMLNFMGLPLNIFGEGGFFQPYLTLQQLDYLSNPNTKWFLVGCSNDVILSYKNKSIDLVLYLDTDDSTDAKIEFIDKDLKDKLNLTYQDRKFIDFIVDQVKKNEEWSKLHEGEDYYEESIPEGAETSFTSKTVNNNLSLDSKVFKGGDDFIRYNFEDYLTGFLSSIKFDSFVTRFGSKLPGGIESLGFDNHIEMFNSKYVEVFKTTKNFKIFNDHTEDELFNFFEPKHVGDAIAPIRAPNLFKNIFDRWGGNSAQTPATATTQANDPNKSPNDDTTTMSTDPSSSNSKRASVTSSIVGAINKLNVKSLSSSGSPTHQSMQLNGNSSASIAESTSTQHEDGSSSGNAANNAATAVSGFFTGLFGSKKNRSRSGSAVTTASDGKSTKSKVSVSVPSDAGESNDKVKDTTEKV